MYDEDQMAEAGAEEQTAVDPVQFLQAVMAAPNVAELLPDEKLAEIATDALRGYEIDHASMEDWRKRMQRGLDLATLIKEDKTYPFENASNVKYPLITTAALQFNARAYPAIVPASEVVKCKTYGKDPSGQKAARAERVGAHMSYQLGSQIEEWEPSTDNLLAVLPIVGTMVRKCWHDPVAGRTRVKLIDPDRFVINDRAKTLEDAPRLSEEIPLFPSEIEERKRAGTYLDRDYVEVKDGDKDAQQLFIEQHCRIDLDEDGYGEPYIVTVCKTHRTVARIVADFGPEDVVMGERGIVAIRRGSYFTDFHFLPSMTGGFFGTGLGALLGDISDTINTIINMLIDAGHMASRGGGFIGSEFRIKGGAQQFKPGEWRLTQSRGADIKSSIVPLTFPGPDATLFQLLGLLIDAGKEVASVKDIMTGDTGTKNMTATTTLALIEQGMMVFTAAYKRIFRSLKREFRLLAKINRETLSPEAYAKFHDMQGHNGGPPMGMPGMPPMGPQAPQGGMPGMMGGAAIPPGMMPQQQMQPMPQMISPQQDYDLSDMDIEPVADPSSVTRMQEATKAQIIMQMAEAGLLDRNEAVQRALQAAGISNTEDLLPKPDPMQAKMMEMQTQAAQADLTLKMVEIDQALADIEKTRSETVKNMTDAMSQEQNLRLDQAKMALEAAKHGIGILLERGPGGLAGTPGNAAGGGMPAQIPGRPAPVGNSGVLGGQAMAGSGPFGPPAGAGSMGRPF